MTKQSSLPEMLKRLLWGVIAAWLIWRFGNWVINPEPINPWFWLGLAPFFAVLLVAVIKAIKERW
jgi:hypothetical protein